MPVTTVSPSVSALVVRDALAVTAGTCAAFIFRAAVRSYDSLAPDHLASLILPALPFCLAAALLSLWSLGFYRGRETKPTLLDVGTSLAWAAAPLAFVAFYWDWGPETPFLVLVTGYVITTLLVTGVRAYR
jgi:hypothetical protein